MELNCTLSIDHTLKSKRKLSSRDHLPSMCRYKSKLCFNPRAFKRNGAPHNLCEKHRAQANSTQMRFDLRRRLGVHDNAERELQTEATKCESRVSRLARVARLASIISRQAAAKELAEEQRRDGVFINLAEPSNAGDLPSKTSDNSNSSVGTESCAFTYPTYCFEPWFANFDYPDAGQAHHNTASSEMAVAAVGLFEVEMEQEFDSWRQLAVQWKDNIPDEASDEAMNYEYPPNSAPSQFVQVRLNLA